MNDWVVDLLGKPYAENGQGPDAFNCWGLVRWVFQSHFKIDMPLIRVGLQDEEQDAEIREASRVSGWRPSTDRAPRDQDILLMQGPYGKHVAVALILDSFLQVLHSVEGMGVMLTPYNELTLYGFRDVKSWRRA